MRKNLMHINFQILGNWWHFEAWSDLHWWALPLHVGAYPAWCFRVEVLCLSFQLYNDAYDDGTGANELEYDD